MTVANNDRISSAGLKKFWQAAYNQIKTVFWKQGDDVTTNFKVNKSNTEALINFEGETAAVITMKSNNSELSTQGEFVINYAANYGVCAMGAYYPLDSSTPELLQWARNTDTGHWSLYMGGTALKAQQDENGNSITSYYASKSWVTNTLNSYVTSSGANADANCLNKLIHTGTAVTMLDSTRIGATSGTEGDNYSYVRADTLASYVNGKILPLSDSNISSASTWNAKQDATSLNDGGRVWEDSFDSGYVYKIGLPGGDTSYATIICHACTKNGWPITFVIGYRWTGAQFQSSYTPKVAILYSTSHSTDDNMVEVRYSQNSRAIYINFPYGIDHRVSFVMSSKRAGSYEFSKISNTSTEFNSSTSTTSGEIEGCVMKTQVGTAIGSNYTPVYVNASGFVSTCTNLQAKSIVDGSGTAYTVGTTMQPVYFQGGVPTACLFYVV